MCGRFTLRAPASVVAEHFALFEMPPWTPRFNIAPTQPVPVVRLSPGTVPGFAPAKPGRFPSTAPAGRMQLPLRPADGAEARSRGDGAEAPSGVRELVLMRWGLVPSWAKDPSIGNRLINARAETAAEKPAFRAALRQRRCLVAADGFYEWRATGGRKQPYFIRLRDDGPFAIAGLWETWTDNGGQGASVPVLESCTLLTTAPNDLLRPIHDRMPAILAANDYAAWLDPAVREPARLLPLLRPYPSEAMVAHPVGTLVNSPANDLPECVAAL